MSARVTESSALQSFEGLRDRLIHSSAFHSRDFATLEPVLQATVTSTLLHPTPVYCCEFAPLTAGWEVLEQYADQMHRCVLQGDELPAVHKSFISPHTPNNTSTVLRLCLRLWGSARFHVCHI